MEKLYTDRHGLVQSIKISTSFYSGEKVYQIYNNGKRFLDLVFRFGTWNELFQGINAESIEYGRLLDSIFVRAAKVE